MSKLDHKMMDISEKIGRGSNGSIYPLKNDKNWVIKHIIARDLEEFLKLMKSIVLGFSCDHPAIIPIKDYSVEEIKPQAFNIYLKMPRMKTNLADFIKQRNDQIKGRLEEEKILEYLYTLVCALEYLRIKDIIHGHIKPNNILFDDEYRINLADVGSGSAGNDEQLENGIIIQSDTGFYMAPEILVNSGGSLKRDDFFAGDVWSLGVVISELCLLKKEMINPHLYPKESIVEKMLARIQKKYSKELVDILRGMVCVDPKQRKSIHEIRQALEKKPLEIQVLFIYQKQ